MKQPSFLDLARHAKVSPATVSRVARGRSGVNAAIRDRVTKAAEELGIDLEVRRHERPTIVAFLLSNRDVLHSFQARILLGAESYCAAHNCELLFISFRYSPAVPAKDLHLPQILSHRSLIQSVILGGTNSPNLMEALRERGIPFSVLGNNVLGEWNASAIDAVYSDDVQGASDLTQQLIDDGHRRIWFIGDTDLPWYRRCSQGYCEAMQRAGLAPRLSEIHSDDHQLGYLMMRSIISRGESATAVFAGSDLIARGVYEAVRQAGLRIPEDISVAGFNDSEAALMYPALTSVREFPEELGRHLAKFVLGRRHSPTQAPQQLTIPTQVVVRASTRTLT